jgi:hypothetical protein
MKNKIKLFASATAFGFFILIAIASGNDEKSVKVECNSSSEGYKSGFEVGKTSLWSTPEAFKKNCNNGNGMFGEVPPCWDEGFIAGYNSK